MFPADEKRSTFMYNETPIQISGLGQYATHPSYDYLEGRKLEDVYESGFKKTFENRYLEATEQVLKARRESGWK